MTPSDVDLGANIRAFRMKRKLSLNELSRITGISASNLSSMELGKTSPTLSTLAKIAFAFGMKAGAFLDQIMYRKVVLCRKESPLESEAQSLESSIRPLTSNVYAGSMESSIIELSSAGEPVFPRGIGTERFFYCLHGEVSVKSDDEIYVLQEEDGLYLLPEAGCELSNPGESKASLLMVVLTGGRELQLG